MPESLLVSFLNELILQIPVLTGAAIAAAGGFATQFVTFKLENTKDRRLVYRDRAEQLVQSLYEYSDWLDATQMSYVFGDADYDAPSPLDKARMIHYLYFPELSDIILDIGTKGTTLHSWIMDQRIAKLADERAWIKSFDRGPYDVGYEEFQAALIQAARQVSSLIKSHLKG